MPFDPTKPENDAPLVAAEMRAQLTALNARIDAVQAGAARKPDLGALSLALNDPPTQAQMQAVIDQLNALLSQLAAG